MKTYDIRIQVSDEHKISGNERELSILLSRIIGALGFHFDKLYDGFSYDQELISQYIDIDHIEVREGREYHGITERGWGVVNILREKEIISKYIGLGHLDNHPEEIKARKIIRECLNNGSTG